MLRQRGICYARCNSLTRNFSLCSPNVKVKPFKTFCCIMYCCQIWSQYKKDTVSKLQMGYNHAFRRIMKYDRMCSASGMFVANDVMSFNELWQKSLHNFKKRVTKQCLLKCHLNGLSGLNDFVDTESLHAYIKMTAIFRCHP